MAQIKVGTNLTKPKSINVFRNGQWLTKRIGKIFKGGVWVQFIHYLLKIYENGIEYLPVEKGYDSYAPVRSFTKQPSYIEIYIETGGSANEMSAVTSNMVDISGYSKVYFDFYQDTPYSSALESSISVTKYKAQTRTSVTALATFRGGIHSGVLELDISQLQGLYYIATYFQVGSYSEGTQRIRRIWLE